MPGCEKMTLMTPAIFSRQPNPNLTKTNKGLGVSYNFKHHFLKAKNHDEKEMMRMPGKSVYRSTQYGFRTRATSLGSLYPNQLDHIRICS
jgi:hypothetical protein